MSLQQLGKKGSPPVIVNGVTVTSNVRKASVERDPPPNFDLRKLAEIAEEAAKKRKDTA